MLRVVLFLVLLSFGPQNEEPKCLAGQDGWSYCFTPEDREWFARALYCEAGSVQNEEEWQAVGWTLIHRFYQTEHVFHSFSRFLQEYCQCLNPEWGSGGSKRTSRDIVARVDEMRTRPMWSFPWATREMAINLLAGRVADKWPTFVHFLASGHESQANTSLFGPYYVTEAGQGRNAFYADSRSVKWLPAPVNLTERSNVECRE